MTIIGYGAIALKAAIKTSKNSVIRYVIEHNSIDFFDPSSGQSIQDLSVFTQNLSNEEFANQGHLHLLALPASPQAAFYDVKLTATADLFILKVQSPERFAQRGKTYFENLDLSFIFPKSGAGLTIEGTVKLCLLGQSDPDIFLKINSSPEGLTFKPSESQILLPGVGSLNINEINLGNNESLWSDIQALYAFHEWTEPGDGEKREFWNGTKNSQQPTKLTVTGKANNLKSVKGGVAFLNSSSRPDDAVRLESTRSGKTISEACKVSQAITISAWIKPAEELPSSGRTPKRIVSLSVDESHRNFTLGQDQDERRNADGKQYNRYIVRLRRGNESFNGTPPLVSKPQAFKVGELTHVVVTRGDSNSPLKTGKIYINGEDQTALDSSDLALIGNPNDYTTNLSGSFEKWDVNYPLVLGDEKNGNRAWAGEIHQVAIYSRSLSELEIFHSYVPDLSLNATLTFSNVPAPFDQALPVTVNFDTNELTIDQPAALLQVAPFLTLDQIKFKWQQQNSNLELILGEVKATLWGNSVDFALRLTDSSFVLTRPTSAETRLTLADVTPLSPLGTLRLTQLTLQANRTEDSSWEFATDAEVTFASIQPPLKGPFPIQLFLDPLTANARKLWFSISPEVPLPLVGTWRFAHANLQFTRDDSGWQGQSDLSHAPHGISLPLFGETRPLAARLVAKGTTKVLELEWTATDIGNLLGQLNLSHFKLESLTTVGERFWQISMAGKIPLDLSSGGDSDSPTDFIVLDFSTVDGELLGNPGNLQQPLQLRGRSLLQSQVSLHFTGDLQLQGDRLLLQGPFTLFPAWSTVQVHSTPQVEIAADGRISFESHTVQATLPESVLINPVLTLATGRLELKGFWLGQPKAQVFRVTERAGELFLDGSSKFSLPFSLNLPALIDDKTGAQLAQAVQIVDQDMFIQMDTEFQPNGFWGLLKAKFKYVDSAKVSQEVILPERRLYSPPASLPALLGDILAQVKATAGELFKEQGRHSKEYYVTLGANQPRIFLSGSGDPELEITSRMPALFQEDVKNLASENGIFTLNQTGGNCTLTLKQTESDPATVKADYTKFLNEQVAKQPLISAGAATLLRRRIAECLPLDYDDLLFYYYGWDVAQGYIDLQAGMRLRVDLQTYQFVHPSEPNARSGFVGSGSFYIPVNSYTFPLGNSHTQLLGFGPFLSRLQVNGSLDITNRGAGSVFDLLREGYRKPYYRLFFPKQPSRGDSSERSVMLVGADTLQEMASATHAVVSSGGSSPTAGVSFFFRGRAVILPEIQVYAGNQPIYVPVGTTIRQLIEMYDDIPAAGLPGQNLQFFIGSTRPLRLVHEEVNSTPSYRFINFEDSGSVGNMDFLDLPLVKGDRISF